MWVESPPTFRAFGPTGGRWLYSVPNTILVTSPSLLAFTFKPNFTNKIWLRQLSSAPLVFKVRQAGPQRPDSAKPSDPYPLQGESPGRRSLHQQLEGATPTHRPTEWGGSLPPKGGRSPERRREGCRGSPRHPQKWMRPSRPHHFCYFAEGGSPRLFTWWGEAEATEKVLAKPTTRGGRPAGKFLEYFQIYHEKY